MLYTLRGEANRKNLAANLAQAESAAGFIADHQNGLLNLLALIASRVVRRPSVLGGLLTTFEHLTTRH